MIDALTIVEAQDGVRVLDQPWFQHSRDQMAGEFRDHLLRVHGIDMSDPAQAEVVLRIADLFINTSWALSLGDPRPLAEREKVRDALQMIVFTMALAAGDVVKAAR